MSAILPPAISHARDSVDQSIRALRLAQTNLDSGDYEEALRLIRSSRDRHTITIDKVAQVIDKTDRTKHHARFLRESEVARADAFADREAARRADTLRA